MPPERSGVASALLNASREVAGLLGITVIGAVLRSREGTALQHGASASSAFLTGYHDGLLVTVALLAFGTLVGYLALRRSGNDHEVPDLEATLAAELAAPDDLAGLDPASASR
jgi:hypothetical protein